VPRTYLNQKCFNQMPRDYKSIDPGLQKTRGRLQKSGFGPLSGLQHCQSNGDCPGNTHGLCVGPIWTKSASTRCPETTNPLTWTTKNKRETTKKRTWATERLAAQWIKWGSSWEHSRIVNRTYLGQIYFTQVSRDYKSIDLDYKKQEGGHKKADLGHWMACSTIH